MDDDANKRKCINVMCGLRNAGRYCRSSGNKLQTAFQRFLSKFSAHFLKLFWNYADKTLELYNSSLLLYRKKEACTACGFSKWWRMDFLVQNSCVCRMRMVFMKGKYERMSRQFLKFFASPCNWCLVRWK